MEDWNHKHAFELQALLFIRKAYICVFNEITYIERDLHGINSWHINLNESHAYVVLEQEYV